MPDDMFHGAALQRMQEESWQRGRLSADQWPDFKLRVAGYLAWTAFSIARRLTQWALERAAPSATERDVAGSQAFSASGHDGSQRVGRLDNLHEHEDDKSSVTAIVAIAIRRVAVAIRVRWIAIPVGIGGVAIAVSVSRVAIGIGRTR